MRQKQTRPGAVDPLMKQHLASKYELRWAEKQAEAQHLPFDMGWARANKQIFEEVNDHLRRKVNITFRLTPCSLLDPRQMVWLQAAQRISILFHVHEQSYRKITSSHSLLTATNIRSGTKSQSWTSQVLSALAHRDPDSLHQFEFVGDIEWMYPDDSSCWSATATMEKVIGVLESLKRVQARRCLFRWGRQELMLREDNIIWTRVLRGYELRARFLAELERLSSV
jgi:hypothetical protein